MRLFASGTRSDSEPTPRDPLPRKGPSPSASDAVSSETSLYMDAFKFVGVEISGAINRPSKPTHILDYPSHML